MRLPILLLFMVTLSGCLGGFGQDGKGAAVTRPFDEAPDDGSPLAYGDWSLLEAPAGQGAFYGFDVPSWAVVEGPTGYRFISMDVKPVDIAETWTAGWALIAFHETPQGMAPAAGIHDLPLAWQGESSRADGTIWTYDQSLDGFEARRDNQFLRLAYLPDEPVPDKIWLLAITQRSEATDLAFLFEDHILHGLNHTSFEGHRASEPRSTLQAAYTGQGETARRASPLAISDALLEYSAWYSVSTRMNMTGFESTAGFMGSPAHDHTGLFTILDDVRLELAPGDGAWQFNQVAYGGVYSQEGQIGWETSTMEHRFPFSNNDRSYGSPSWSQLLPDPIPADEIPGAQVRQVGRGIGWGVSEADATAFRTQVEGENIQDQAMYAASIRIADPPLGIIPIGTTCHSAGFQEDVVESASDPTFNVDGWMADPICFVPLREPAL